VEKILAKRLNIVLSDEVANKISSMSVEDNQTMTEVIRQAVSLKAFVRDVLANGEKILILDPDTEKVREVVFHD